MVRIIPGAWMSCELQSDREGNILCSTSMMLKSTALENIYLFFCYTFKYTMSYIYLYMYIQCTIYILLSI